MGSSATSDILAPAPKTSCVGPVVSMAEAFDTDLGSGEP
jgi:hypothetical protein